MSILNLILFALSTALILSIIIRYVLNILKCRNYTLSVIEIREDNKTSYQIFQPYNDMIKKLTVKSFCELLLATLFVRIVYNFI